MINAFNIGKVLVIMGEESTAATDTMINVLMPHCIDCAETPLLPIVCISFRRANVIRI